MTERGGGGEVEEEVAKGFSFDTFTKPSNPGSSVWPLLSSSFSRCSPSKVPKKLKTTVPVIDSQVSTTARTDVRGGGRGGKTASTVLCIKTTYR